MDKVTYTLTQQQVLLIAQLVQGLDLDEFLRSINWADTVGPIVDPTLWMRGSKNMAFIEELARAASRFKEDVRKAHERAGIPLPEVPKGGESNV